MATSAAAAAAVCSGIGPFGRGRGRGRGLRVNALQQPGASIPGQCIPPKAKAPADKPTSTTSEKSQYEDVNGTIITEETYCAEVTNIMKKLSGLTESQVMNDILPQIEELQGQQVIEDLVNALSEKALCDPTFAVIAAKIAHKLWDNVSMHSFIRNPLLKKTQEFYNKKEILQKEKKYHGLCVFLCQLFKLLRLRQQPLLPVGDAVVQLLKGLIEKGATPSNEDVFYFYVELEGIGGIIGEHFPEKLEEVINLARQMVISSSIVPSVRCRLVQLIELHAANWSMKDELKTLYNDLLSDLKSQENKGTI